MAKCYLQKLRSRPPGSAKLFDTPPSQRRLPPLSSPETENVEHGSAQSEARSKKTGRRLSLILGLRRVSEMRQVSELRRVSRLRRVAEARCEISLTPSRTLRRLERCSDARRPVAPPSLTMIGGVAVSAAGVSNNFAEPGWRPRRRILPSRRSSAQRLRATHDLEDFFRDGSLAGVVHGDREFVDQFFGVVGCVVHRHELGGEE